MKAMEELNVLKEEVETLNNKFMELNEENLEQVRGGEQILTKEMLIKDKKRAFVMEKRKIYSEQLKNGEITRDMYDRLIEILNQAVQNL